MIQSINDLYREKAEDLLSFIRRRISDPEEAEDILQEIFARAVEAPSVLGPIENLLGWLYTAARNRIIDVYRKKGRSPKQQELTEEETLEELLASADLGPEDEFLQGLLEEALDEAIDELPEEQRWVFVRQAVFGISFRELAEETGLSINTLMARKRYAVLFLRKRLSAVYQLIHDGGNR